MGSFVGVQSGRVLEGFRTMAATVNGRRGVDVHMLPQGARVDELLSADIAVVLPDSLTGVPALVDSHDSDGLSDC